MAHFRDKPVVVLGVNNDDDPEAARKVMSSQQMFWRCWQTSGTENAIARRWKINTYPSVYVIDANGVIRHALLSGNSLERAVQNLVTELEAKRPG